MEKKLYPLRFIPIASRRPWGGNALVTKLGKAFVECDEEGNELEGYKSIKIFGDSVERKVKFEKNLADLAGKPVRLKIELHDCDLYSFKFN